MKNLDVLIILLLTANEPHTLKKSSNAENYITNSS